MLDNSWKGELAYEYAASHRAIFDSIHAGGRFQAQSNGKFVGDYVWVAADARTTSDFIWSNGVRLDTWNQNVRYVGDWLEDDDAWEEILTKSKNPPVTYMPYSESVIDYESKLDPLSDSAKTPFFPFKEVPFPGVDLQSGRRLFHDEQNTESDGWKLMNQCVLLKLGYSSQGSGQANTLRRKDREYVIAPCDWAATPLCVGITVESPPPHWPPPSVPPQLPPYPPLIPTQPTAPLPLEPLLPHSPPPLPLVPMSPMVPPATPGAVTTLEALRVMLASPPRDGQLTIELGEHSWISVTAPLVISGSVHVTLTAVGAGATLDGQGIARVLEVENGANLVLRRVHIVNGRAGALISPTADCFMRPCS